MVNAHTFVSNKADQLSFYADALIMGQIPEDEVDLYCWDTLEEWSQVNPRDAKITQRESAFWYLLHQLAYWTTGEILSCPKLRSEVGSCVQYLKGHGHFPDFCQGVRP